MQSTEGQLPTSVAVSVSAVVAESAADCAASRSSFFQILLSWP